MTSATDLRAEVAGTHRRFLDAMLPLGDAVLETEAACGVWPVREVAGHIAAWNLLILAWARAAVEGSQEGLEPVRDFDGFNAESAVRTSAMSWEDVKAELDSTIASADELLAGITDEQLSMPAAYPWGSSGTLEGLLRGVNEHQGEHLHELLDWLEGRSGA